MSNWHLSSLNAEQREILNRSGWYLRRDGKRTILTTNMGREPEELNSKRGANYSTQGILHACLGEPPHKSNGKHNETPSSPLEEQVRELKLAASERRDQALSELKLEPGAIDEQSIEALLPSPKFDNDCDEAIKLIRDAESILKKVLKLALDDILATHTVKGDAYQRSAKQYRARFESAIRALESYSKEDIAVINALNPGKTDEFHDLDRLGSDLTQAFEKGTSLCDQIVKIKQATQNLRAKLSDLAASLKPESQIAKGILLSLVTILSSYEQIWQRNLDDRQESTHGESTESEESIPEIIYRRSLRTADIANLREHFIAINELLEEMHGLVYKGYADLSKGLGSSFAEEIASHNALLRNSHDASEVTKKILIRMARSQSLFFFMAGQELYLNSGLEPSFESLVADRKEAEKPGYQLNQVFDNLRERLRDAISQASPESLRQVLLDYLSEMQQALTKLGLKNNSTLIERVKEELKEPEAPPQEKPETITTLEYLIMRQIKSQ